ncbi:MAG: hypothetical protein K8T90_15230 [Planctomycetes bacterium]|nr:hypothetical protein [Planctomycetota bacterium]
MAEKTETLMKSCTDATKRLEQDISGIESQMKALTGALSRLEAMDDGKDVKVLQVSMESVVTERTFTRGVFSRMDISIDRAQKAAKELAAKVKSKDFLNHFKDQKSLGAAKVTLKATEDAIADAVKAKSTGESAMMKLERKAEEQSARVVQLSKAATRGGDSGAKEVVEDLEAFVRDTVKSSSAALAKIVTVTQGKEKLLAALQNELKSKKTWTTAERDNRIDGANVQFKELEELQSQAQKLTGHVRNVLDKIPVGPVKGESTVKAALAKADAACNAFIKAQSVTEDRVLDVASAFRDIKSDLDIVATTDGNLNLDAERKKAMQTLEQYLTIAEHAPTWSQFEGSFETCKGWINEVAPWVKTPSLLGEKERARLGVIAKGLGDEQMQCDASFPGVVRTLKQAEAIAKRWKNVKEIQTAFKQIGTFVALRKKQYDAFKKAATGLEAALKKLGA